MNAVAKTPAPRSVADLSADIAALEKTLMEIRRDESAARTKLPRFIEEGDTIRSTDARRSIELAPARIASLSAELEQTREALKLAKGRVQGASNAQTYRRLKQCVTVAREHVETAEAALDAFGKALLQARESLENAAAQMRDSGLTEDPFLMRAKLQGLAQLRLHMESGGIVGVKRTLDSDHQLRQSGAASFKKAAAEYHALTLQRVRSALHITE
jgi:chromosome segregation ATPase